MNKGNPWEQKRLAYISQALNDMERGYAQGRHSEGQESLSQMSRIAAAEDTIKAMNAVPQNMSPAAWAMMGEGLSKMQSGWDRNVGDHYTNSQSGAFDMYNGRRRMAAALGIPVEQLFPIRGGALSTYGVNPKMTQGHSSYLEPLGNAPGEEPAFFSSKVRPWGREGN
jgi:hypothetical protein